VSPTVLFSCSYYRQHALDEGLEADGGGGGELLQKRTFMRASIVLCFIIVAALLVTIAAVQPREG
jgi:hypothetical protein